MNDISLSKHSSEIYSSLEKRNHEERNYKLIKEVNSAKHIPASYTKNWTSVNPFGDSMQQSMNVEFYEKKED